jgi:hypothetical protein
MKVQAAGSDTLQGSQQLLNCSWKCDGHEFHINFCILHLATYDGILGLDSLVQHNIMHVHWTQKWISFFRQGEHVVLQSLVPPYSETTVV